MTAPSQSTFPLTLDLMHDLLGVDPYDGPRRLLAKARTVRGVISPLVLSLAAREGVPMGTGARDELARMQRRARTYRDLYDVVTAVPGARVIKGPSIARHYPEGVLRPLGDLDVIVEAEETLWRVLGTVLDRHRSDEADLAELTEPDGRHLIVSVWWPGEDPLLDADHGVEVSTFGFTGQAEQAVPLRAALPGDRVIADVLALAEERFQRDFTVKDVVDLVCVLSSPAAPDPTDLATAAGEWLVAPELEELCLRLTAHPDLAEALPAGLLSALHAPAGAERARRTARGPQPQGPRRHGFQLSTPLRRGAGLSTVDHGVADQTIRRTPIADFMLVTDALVDPAAHEKVQLELAGLDPWPLRPGTGD